MPLKRLTDGFDAQLEGVFFGMKNQNGDTIRCLASHEALTDKIHSAGAQEECIDAFKQYREEIEEIASAKYDQGLIEGNGIVLVRSRDLNPEQFAGVP